MASLPLLPATASADDAPPAAGTALTVPRPPLMACSPLLTATSRSLTLIHRLPLCSHAELEWRGASSGAASPRGRCMNLQSSPYRQRLFSLQARQIRICNPCCSSGEGGPGILRSNSLRPISVQAASSRKTVEQHGETCGQGKRMNSSPVTLHLGEFGANLRHNSFVQ